MPPDLKVVADQLPNGPGAAAILAAGFGCGMLGIFACGGDAFRVIGRALTIWPPAGPLSGVTTAAIAVWLAAWFALARRWARRDVNLARVNLAAGTMLIIGLLTTFPPIMDLLHRN